MPAMNQDRSWMAQLAGKFVVFDGPDGSGKSTQFHRLTRAVSETGTPVCEVREPGGTLIGEHIRNLEMTIVYNGTTRWTCAARCCSTWPAGRSS